MTSLCWSCRLRLLTTSTSRVPLRPTPTYLAQANHHRSRGFQVSSERSLPRSRVAARTRSASQHDGAAEVHRNQGDGPGEQATIEQDNVNKAQEIRQQRRRQPRALETRRRVATAQRATTIEANVRLARQTFGDSLPEGLLDADGMRVYERLYGAPTRVLSQEDLQQERDGQQRQSRTDSKLMRQTENGDLEDVGIMPEQDISPADKHQRETVLTHQDGLTHDVDDLLLLSYSDALAQHAQDEDKLTPEQKTLLASEHVREAFEARAEDLTPEADVARDQEGREDEEDDDDPDLWPGDDTRVRTHPLTAMGRFCTTPTTIQFSKTNFIDPVTQAIAPVTTRQMRIVAEQIFDGPGLPYSPATPRRSRLMPQKPIPLLASNKHLNDMESFVYAATVMPGVYASTLSVLTEVRKRLGKSWLRGLMQKEGGPVILDAGAGGAGVLAWRDVLKAEWEATCEEAAMGGADYGLPDHPPVGKATVVTASSSLRNRATQLLNDTAFIPRMPEAVKPNSQEQRKQYDLIIAPHTLWPLEKDYMRKLEVERLWSLLNPAGGVLVLLEKGVPRGFEVVAGARAHLLKRHIADSSPSTDVPADEDIYSRDDSEGSASVAEKEQGMIVAPCTNHGPCPMYKYAGISQARKDWCYFSQRFIRPPFLQHILGAKQMNHDDVEFSYVAVQRGKDLRRADALQHEDERILGATAPPVQGPEVNDAAFKGFEGHPTTTHSGPLTTDNAATDLTAFPLPSETASPLAPHPLSLPRLILPPLKRKKHIVLDVCTPAATLERWVVTRGFSAQAYRDARKSSWGDLWALGAKQRSAKRVNLGKQVKQLEEMERRKAEGRKTAETGVGMDVDVRRWRKKAAKQKRRKEGRRKIDLLER